LGSLNDRLRKLEATRGYGAVGSGQFRPLKDADPLERGEVLADVIGRLTHLELSVLDELVEKRERHPDLNGAQFYSMMSDVEHEFEREFNKIVRSVVRDRAEGIDTGAARREELRKRSVEELESEPLPWLWWQRS